MKTLLDIDTDLMEKLLRETGTKVKKEAVVTAIKAYLDARRREKLAELIGNYELGCTAEDLERMREDGQSRH
jgi:Arc/MetJ family transcription regulator